MATNKVSFYFRKDFNVTKHGEYKAGTDLLQGDAVKRNQSTKELEIAQNSEEFEGVAFKWLLNTQGTDNLEIPAGQRCLVGVGTDYEFVILGNQEGLQGMNEGEQVAVEAGKFVSPSDGNDAVGEVVQKFPNGEVAVLIY